MFWDEVESRKEAAASCVEPAAPRSPPAKDGLPKVRPNESDGSGDSDRMEMEKIKDDDRSSSESAGDDSGDDSGSGSADSTTDRKRWPAVGEIVWNGPDLARELQLADQANVAKYMIAHGRMPDAEASSGESGDTDGPAGALARGGERSLQLGECQAA